MDGHRGPWEDIWLSQCTGLILSRICKMQLWNSSTFPRRITKSRRRISSARFWKISMCIRKSNDFHILCVCHITNRSVLDASNLVKKEVDMLRVIVKTIRSSELLRNTYSELIVVLGRTFKQTPPSLGVETRWSTKFLMMEECFENRNIIEALCNCEECKDQMIPLKMTDIEWRFVKASKDFLETAY